MSLREKPASDDTVKYTGRNVQSRISNTQTLQKNKNRSLLVGCFDAPFCPYRAKNLFNTNKSLEIWSLATLPLPCDLSPSPYTTSNL